MKRQFSPWALAIVAWSIWAAIVLGGEWLQVGGSTVSLGALVSSQLVLALLAAPVFLLIVVARRDWWRDVGFRFPSRLYELRLLWLPALFIAGFFVLVAASGLPPAKALGFIVINTLLVGFSEELMFRGILLHGALSRFSVIAAVVICAIMFGAIHALNGVLTGDFVAASAQALQATLFGVWIAALRLRLNSIWPVIVIHALWDLGIFLLPAGPAVQGSGQLGLAAFFTPALIELPLLLYGLWLLRGFRLRPASVVR